ncbi:hypothetical protein ABE82_26215 (plasmid) [Paenibacillus peoriae]|uniref:hypothetical protein n=1 Tax=Paenibacillus peoriae TaxID=59893 RepID=UPI0007209FB2|nr:hypothetical protein [Paenibacillus peoriae]ALS09917.1 hypothetical protein ABE82_26215 [Paenibacillus peoriae]
MAADIIPFPLGVEQPENNDPFEEAIASIEERFGVTISDYLGFTGDPDETQKIVQRNMNRETL